MFAPFFVKHDPRQRTAAYGNGTRPLHHQLSNFTPTRPQSHTEQCGLTKIQKQAGSRSVVRLTCRLGGKDNFAADRASGDAIAARFPGIRTTCQQNRAFLHRAVTYLARDAGITQYLDIGTGLPTTDNTHQIAQRHKPEARIVYADNDPLVLAHARALLTSPDPAAGAIAYLDADLRQPHTILDHPALTTTLDLNRPIALLLLAVLHFLPDTDHPHEIVQTLVDALAPGSCLVISHATYDLLPLGTTLRLRDRDLPGLGDFTARTHPQINRFLTGLTVLRPGLQVISRWRPHPGTVPPPDQDVAAYGAIAVKGTETSAGHVPA